MKSAIFASVFALGALAQVSVVTDAFTTIGNDVTALDNGVTSYTGGDVSSLQALATTLVNDINSANSAVSAIDTLSDTDALTLVGPINALSSTVQTATTDVVNAKSTFDAAGQGFAILQNLQAIQAATSTFSATVISKAGDLQSEASVLAQPIIDALNSAVNAYAGETQGSTSTTSPTSTVTSSSATSTSTGTTTGVTTVTPTTVQTTTPIGTVTPIRNSTTSTLVPFNAAPTAAAGYGVIALAALGAIAAL